MFIDVITFVIAFFIYHETRGRFETTGKRGDGSFDSFHFIRAIKKPQESLNVTFVAFIVPACSAGDRFET